jgi:ATP-binding cassette subfamily C (CFTR/MRP) protein 1
MVVVQSGHIILDGVDISSLEATDVRSRINVVPQDPFFLPGSLRLNLDPSGSIPNDRLIRALGRVGLSVIGQDTEGLDKPLDLATLSAGQKQLLCLARAMVKGGAILVLDEAASRYVLQLVLSLI